MADGSVTYTQAGGWHVLRYSGRVDYTMAPAIERFVDGLEHAPKPFLFDLCDANILDSTNLGLLARVVERSRKDGAPRCSMIVHAGDVDDVVRSMGFEQIVDIKSDSPLGEEVEPQALVTDERASQGEMLRTMLEAHRALIGLDDHDCSQWREVVSALEAEMRTR
ncbi:MAG TPA: STAS domain-containing protein [Polyangia bacterium]